MTKEIFARSYPVLNKNSIMEKIKEKKGHQKVTSDLAKVHYNSRHLHFGP